LTRIERLTQAERLASERQTRAERQAITRERLVEAASDLFRRDGYAITSIDRIAQAAGYTKGAVYSNFEDKEAIFSAFGAEANENLGALAPDRQAPTREAVIEEVAQWANERSRHGGWSFPVLELARSLSPGPAGSDPATAPASVSASCSEHLEAIVRNGWRRLGEHCARASPWPVLARDARRPVVRDRLCPGTDLSAQPACG
jgi:AcrR family transcriptional regulator